MFDLSIEWLQQIFLNQFHLNHLKNGNGSSVLSSFQMAKPPKMGLKPQIGHFQTKRALVFEFPMLHNPKVVSDRFYPNRLPVVFAL